MGILVARSRAELKALIASERRGHTLAGSACQVGFVPTMGALHGGHATLIRSSAIQNSVTVVSIFVNPKQFSANEDLSKYPRTFDADCALCESSGARIVFAPTVEEMYPEEFYTQISVPEMSDVLCGAYRPNHFNGVCTVVMLLLNLAGADTAYFGLKDFQQFSIISRMVRDVAHPTRLVGVPTVRDPDGLAMSSRNRFLDTSARAAALCIPDALRAAAACFLGGEIDAAALLLHARRRFEGVSGFELQYCEMRDAATLQTISGNIGRDAVLAVAGFAVGRDGVRTRLIDNVILARDSAGSALLRDFAGC